MAHAMEVVQIRVKPESVDALLATRSEAIRAIRAFPGFISAYLAHLEGERWIDVWLWQSKEAALAAAEQAPRLPALARHFEHMAEIVSMDHAEIRSEIHG